jgi:hypothetical protein
MKGGDMEGREVCVCVCVCVCVSEMARGGFAVCVDEIACESARRLVRSIDARMAPKQNLFGTSVGGC